MLTFNGNITLMLVKSTRLDLITYIALQWCRSSCRELAMRQNARRAIQIRMHYGVNVFREPFHPLNFRQNQHLTRRELCSIKPSEYCPFITVIISAITFVSTKDAVTASFDPKYLDIRYIVHDNNLQLRIFNISENGCIENVFSFFACLTFKQLKSFVTWLFISTSYVAQNVHLL